MDKEKAAAECQRRYARAWRKAHPDRVREYNARYWKKRAEKEAKQNGDNTPTEES